MSQRIELCDTCGCNKPVQSNNVNNGSTFIVTLDFKSILGSTDICLIDTFDLIADFYIIGQENTIKRFIKQSISNESVLINKKLNQIKFIFQDYQFNTGKLHYKLRFSFINPNIPSQVQSEFVEGYTGINLV